MSSKTLHPAVLKVIDVTSSNFAMRIFLNYIENKELHLPWLAKAEPQDSAEFLDLAVPILELQDTAGFPGSAGPSLGILERPESPGRKVTAGPLATVVLPVSAGRSPGYPGSAGSTASQEALDGQGGLATLVVLVILATVARVEFPGSPGSSGSPERVASRGLLATAGPLVPAGPRGSPGRGLGRAGSPGPLVFPGPIPGPAGQAGRSGPRDGAGSLV